MRAVVYDRYGPPEVLRVEDVERPAPRGDEVLVKIHATTVTRTDCGVRGARPFFVRFFTGLLRPKRNIIGMEFAGEVEAAGEAVTEFTPGDRVFGVKGFGANAEYVCVRASAPLAHMPAGLSFDDAAAVCDGAALALACLRKVNLQPGRRIVVYGASGSVGTASVQLAHHFGAHVTAVCGTKNLELMHSLGADEAIDYTREDFTKNGKTYDIVLDTYGKYSYRRCKRSLEPRGAFVATDGLHNVLWVLSTKVFGDKRAIFGVVSYTKDNVQFLRELIEAGEYRAVIDRTYPLEDVVDATRYVETGQKTGNVVLTVTP
jgi:NADPH:quinone reductase-like Zn-dependent oxidoreductase